jgi:hypothetical protein
MRKLALGALFAGLAACSGGKGQKTIDLPDSNMMMPDGNGNESGVCNPLTQTGCAPGQKCNWIYEQLEPVRVGHIGCEPAGTVAIGGSCGDAAIGPDPCVTGAECVNGRCEKICDYDGRYDGAQPMCDEAHVCSSYLNLFVEGTSNVAGVCDPACDPLTQQLMVDDTEACGSEEPARPRLGCYGGDEFSCSRTAPIRDSDNTPLDLDLALQLTDRTTPAGRYRNSCAPGFMSISYTETGSNTFFCTGICAALEVDNTPAHVNNELGDPTAPAKNPTDPAPQAGNATCEVLKRGSATPETCRFMWPILINDDDPEQPTLLVTQWTDKLGLCFPYTLYHYDSDGDGMRDSEYPPCATLPPEEADRFGCQKFVPAEFASSGRPVKVGDRVRVGERAMQARSIRAVDPKDGAVPVRRHLFAN